MSVVLGFLLVVALIAGWWLSRQHLFAKPWLETGEWPAAPVESSQPAAKLGLGVFLAVVGALFALFGSALLMRMEFADWYQLRLPRIVWANTAMLVASSVSLQVAVRAVHRDDLGGAISFLALGGISAFGFLAGQMLAWRLLIDAGLPLASSPGASFFYLITGLHGLHLVGGLIALGRTWARLQWGVDRRRVQLGLELCAIYWHFLLFVWLGMLLLLTGWASDLGALCRAVLS